MKQIRECMDRAFEGKRPLAKKWKAVISNDETNYLFLTHYHHLILVYDLDTNTILHKWWERPADKRGLDSAMKLIEEREYACV